MDLPSFISEVGDPKAAELFQVSARTVKSWKYRERTPRPAKAVFIERVTKGRVRFADIYEQANG